MRTIKLIFGTLEVEAELSDTATADAVWNAPPIDSTVRTWGEEVYFEVPVSAEPEPDARDVVEAGEVGYWLAGSCIAICFGPTPVSTGDEIRLASEANIFGRLAGDPGVLRAVAAGSPVRVERVGGLPNEGPPSMPLRGV